MKIITYWLRWLAVLPTAVLLFVLSIVAFMWFFSSERFGVFDLSSSMLLRSDFNGRYILGPVWCLGVAVASCCGFVVAFKVAPSHRREAAFALAGALAIVQLFWLGLCVYAMTEPDTAMTPEVFIRQCLQFGPGIVLGFFIAHDQTLAEPSSSDTP